MINHNNAKYAILKTGLIENVSRSKIYKFEIVYVYRLINSSQEDV